MTQLSQLIGQLASSPPADAYAAGALWAEADHPSAAAADLSDVSAGLQAGATSDGPAGWTGDSGEPSFHCVYNRTVRAAEERPRTDTKDDASTAAGAGAAQENPSLPPSADKTASAASGPAQASATGTGPEQTLTTAATAGQPTGSRVPAGAAGFHRPNRAGPSGVPLVGAGSAGAKLAGKSEAGKAGQVPTEPGAAPGASTRGGTAADGASPRGGSTLLAGGAAGAPLPPAAARPADGQAPGNQPGQAQGSANTPAAVAGRTNGVEDTAAPNGDRPRDASPAARLATLAQAEGRPADGAAAPTGPGRPGSAAALRAEPPKTTTPSTTAEAAGPAGPFSPDVKPAQVVQDLSAEPAPVEAAAPADQVLAALRGGVVRAGRQITVHLDPPEMGRVRITFQVDGGGLRGVLRAENAQTLTELQRQTPALIDRLADSDIRLRSLDFVLEQRPDGADADGSRHDGTQQDQQAMDQPARRDGDAHDGGSPTPDVPRQWADRAGGQTVDDGSVNIWI